MIDMKEFILITSNLSNIKLALERHEYHRTLVKRFYNYLPSRYHNTYLTSKIEDHDALKVESNLAEVFTYSTYKRGDSWGAKDVSLDVKRLLIRASEDHYKVSTHHPEFWGSTEMDRNSVIEMICDWSAVQYEIYGNLKNLKKWYLDTGNKKFTLNNNNEKLVLELITILQGRF